MQVNEKIKDNEVRVIAPDGQFLGIMSASEALKQATNYDLDLVKVVPNANPPVCKIIDYGKYCYQKQKKEKEAKKKQNITEVKEIRFSSKIEENDLNTKIGQAEKFILSGKKVKVSIRFRGRELSNMSNGYKLLDKFYDSCKGFSFRDGPPIVEGRSLSMILKKDSSNLVNSKNGTSNKNNTFNENHVTEGNVINGSVKV